MRIVRRGVLAVFLLAAALGLPAQAQQDGPALLSAYFGLDDSLPFGANRLCPGSANEDGMPVIFSMEVDPETLDKEDFAVMTDSGVVGTPVCVTLDPATDPGELRTVLLTGEFGAAEGDAPARVEIVGDILALEDPSVNFLGASVAVTPLSAGPSIILAEQVPLAQWRLDQPSDRQTGDGCPSAGTLLAVRVTWAGGVSNRAGDEAGEPERMAYRVALTALDGSSVEVTPFALADLGDGDNNHLLCLDVRGTPVSVTFPEGYLLDPNEDTLNPASTAAVQINPDSVRQSLRDVRYCEVIPTYRSRLSLRSEVWNTLGLNDCPADQWDALDAAALQDELGALTVTLNGPRYWVLDEIGALGGITAAGNRATFGGIAMEQRAVLETPLRTAVTGAPAYSFNTIRRDTRYVFYAGDLIYTLTDSDGRVYVMQSYAQIVDPELTIDALETLGERLALPDGWQYAAVRLASDLILIASGEATVVQDDLQNSYQQADIDLSALAQQ